MKLLRFFLLVLLGFSVGQVRCQAQELPADFPYFMGYKTAQWPSEKKPKSADFRMSEDDFVGRYGITDTAAAIAHLYYRRRRAGLWTARISTAAGYGVGLVLRLQRGEAEAANAKAGFPGAPIPPDAPWLLPALSASLSVALGGVVYAAFWPRRACYTTLQRYHAQGLGTLPPRVRRHLPKYLMKTRLREFGD